MNRHMCVLLRLTLGSAVLAACAPDVGIETSEHAIAPAGADATITSFEVPPTLAPGERAVVRVQVQNTGTVPWGANTFALVPQNNLLQWPVRLVTTDVAPGQSVSFAVVITAPDAGTSVDFAASMYSLVPGENGAFGASLQTPVRIDPSRARNWACQHVSDDLPAQLAPGERRAVSITVQNAGTRAWVADSTFCLYQRDGTQGSLPSPQNHRWGAGGACPKPSADVAPGASATFSFVIEAPSTPGVYSFRRQMYDGAGAASGAVDFFDRDDFCLDTTISVGGAQALDATITQETLPRTLDLAEQVAATITVQNTGGSTWPADGSFMLHTLTTGGLFGRHISPVTTPVPPGGSITLPIPVRAPLTPGTYDQTWRMFDARSGFFGATLTVPTVVNNPPPLYGVYRSDDVPRVMRAGETRTVTYTFLNAGTATWRQGQVQLGAATFDRFLWGTFAVELPNGAVVAPGQTVDFTFTIQAPATPGVHFIEWKMLEPYTGIGFFGVGGNRPVSVVP